MQLHLVIRGQVQGVLFRYGISQLAEKLKLTGWVKNIGQNVEAIFQGEENKLKEILAYCKQGPQMAEVNNVEEKWEQETEQYSQFSINN